MLCLFATVLVYFWLWNYWEIEEVFLSAQEADCQQSEPCNLIGTSKAKNHNSRRSRRPCNKRLLALLIVFLKGVHLQSLLISIFSRFGLGNQVYRQELFWVIFAGKSKCMYNLSHEIDKKILHIVVN